METDLKKAQWSRRRFLWTALGLSAAFLTTAFFGKTAKKEQKTGYRPENFEKELELLDDPAITGYIVWLFSGARNQYLENDQFSFYQGDPMCDVLKQKSATLSPGKFIGVNIHSLANHSVDSIEDNLSYLSEKCGVSVIRIWGTPDRGAPDHTKKVLDVAQRYSMKTIVVLADYSNSSGDILPPYVRENPTDWYKSLYKVYYLPHVKRVVSTLKHHPALFGYELASEAHCSGKSPCLYPYRRWADAVAWEIKKIDWFAKVGIGQKANEQTTLGDSPQGNQFRTSNTSPSIDMTSGHYYAPEEKDIMLLAKKQSRQLGKLFYVGEAGFVTR